MSGANLLPAVVGSMISIIGTALLTHQLTLRHTKRTDKEKLLRDGCVQLFSDIKRDLGGLASSDINTARLWERFKDVAYDFYSTFDESWNDRIRTYKDCLAKLRQISHDMPTAWQVILPIGPAAVDLQALQAPEETRPEGLGAVAAVSKKQDAWDEQPNNTRDASGGEEVVEAAGHTGEFASSDSLEKDVEIMAPDRPKTLPGRAMSNDQLLTTGTNVHIPRGQVLKRIVRPGSKPVIPKPLEPPDQKSAEEHISISAPSTNSQDPGKDRVVGYHIMAREKRATRTAQIEV